MATQLQLIPISVMAANGITSVAVENTQLKDGPKFVCPQKCCRKEFVSADLLLEHRKEGHSNRIFKCHYAGCYWDFMSKKQLDKHILCHTHYKPYVCTAEGCNATFTTQFNLNSHLKQHKLKVMIKCPVISCDEKFLTERALILHKQLLHHEKLFKCKQCPDGPIFTSFVQWQVHQRTHPVASKSLINALQDLKMYQCTVPDCKASFVHPYKLKEHVQAEHTSKSVLKCPVLGCKRLFTFKSNLQRHLRTHLKEKTFGCDVQDCGKTFSRLEHLRRHQKCHTHGTTFKCNMEGCGKLLASAFQLRCHTDTHLQSEAVVCGVSGCAKQFISFSVLKHHCLSSHGIDFKNGEEFQSDSEAQHVYVCNMSRCCRKFIDEDEFLKHLLAFHGSSPSKNSPKKRGGKSSLAERIEKEVQTDADPQYSSVPFEAYKSKLEEGKGLLSSQDFLPFMSMTPPSVVIDRTLLRQEHLQQDASKRLLPQMSALETLAHVAIFKSTSDRKDTASDVIAEEVDSSSLFPESAAQSSDLPANFRQDLFERMEFIRDEALSDSNIFSIIQKDLECAQNVEIPCTDDQSRDCYEELNINLESSVTKGNSDPNIDVLIGTDDTLSTRVDSSFNPYFRNSLPNDSEKEEDQPCGFQDDDVEVEVVTRCDLDVSMDGVSFNFGSILDHDGYISSGSLYGVIPLNSDR